MERFERARRETGRRILFQRLKESKTAIVFVLLIVAALSWSVYRGTDKVIEQNTLSGVLVGIHQVQGKLGSATTRLSIRLSNGETVMVVAPINFIVRTGSEVVVIRDKTAQGAVYHYFGGYK